MSNIEMPQLGETVTEGTITRWFKQVGDTVEADEILFEVSTDKVDSEVPSPIAGVLTEIRVPEGDTVDVGTVLAVIGDSAGAPAEAAPAAAAEAPAAAPEPAPAKAPAPAPAAEAPAQPEPAPAAAPEPAPAAAPEPASAPAEAPAPAPAAEAPAQPAPAPVAEAPAQPAPAPVAEAPVQPAPAPVAEPAPEPAPAAAPEPAPAAQPAAAAAAVSGGDGDGRLLSPVVRRLIREHSLDPDGIEGTGVGGRITRNDVLKAIDQGAAAAPAPPAAPAAPAAPAEPAAAAAPAAQPAEGAPAAAPAPAPAAAAPRVPAATSAGDSEWQPFSNIRRRTAEHMAMSLATSAHALTVVEVDYEGVDRVRSRTKDGFHADEGFSLTYLPFICRAVVDAMRDWPHVNASVEGEGLRVYRDINLGIAVDLDYQGLIVPVVRQADGRRLRALAREINDLAARARNKQLGVDEITGGTFTVSNNGSFGTYTTAAIINQPQVAVLSTDGITRRPVVVTDEYDNESIAIHSVGNLAMAWDHRAFDGSYAGAFLRQVKQIIETRDWSAEL